MMQWLRTVALACAVARTAAVVVIDGSTPSCALTTGEIGQLHAAKNHAELAAAAPCVLYDTAATAPPADVTELTVVQAGPSYCICLLYTSPSPRDGLLSRMPSSA